MDNLDPSGEQKLNDHQIVLLYCCFGGLFWRYKMAFFARQLFEKDSDKLAAFYLHQLFANESAVLEAAYLQINNCNTLEKMQRYSHEEAELDTSDHKVLGTFYISKLFLFLSFINVICTGDLVVYHFLGIQGSLSEDAIIKEKGQHSRYYLRDLLGTRDALNQSSLFDASSIRFEYMVREMIKESAGTNWKVT